MVETVLAQLETLLAEERTALLDADYGQLATLAPEKARLVAQLSKASEEPQMLARAGAGLRRNQAILAAALSGLRDATGRGEARRAVAEAFSTYDRSGALSTVRGPTNALQKRA